MSKGLRQISAFTDSLAVRLGLLLSLALLPIGAIAVLQTAQLSEQLRSEARDAVLARSLDATAAERTAIEHAFGAAEALGVFTLNFSEDTENCNASLTAFVDSSPKYSFAAVVEQDLYVRCSSAGRVLDVTTSDGAKEAFVTGNPVAALLENPQVSRRPVITIYQPMRVAGELSHLIVISIPRSEILHPDTEDLEGVRSIQLFGPDGSLLQETVTEEGEQELPADVALAALTSDQQVVFSGQAVSGAERVYSVVPIYPGVVFAILSWAPEEVGFGSSGMLISPWIFPIFMWLATLGVIYIAVNYLVVRHVRWLGRRMNLFARNRQLSRAGPVSRQPAEIREMNLDFEKMAEAIVRDEAELENALREKNLLIREVHHRVKNNLQLIASIMNMQARRANSPETSRTVRRLQDRVLGLAAVYRRMYESDTLSEMPVKDLIDELMSQSLATAGDGRIEYESEIEDVALIPDQAVALALLAAEAGANAVAHADGNEQSAAWIKSTLRQAEDGVVEFSVVNSLGASAEEPEEPDSAQGLGARLVRAFAGQLGGKLITERGEDRYTVAVSFAT